SDLGVQLVEGGAQLTQYLVSAGREVVDARGLGTRRFRRAKPAALSHPRQDRVQRAGAETVPMMAQFLEHPLAVNAAPVGGMMEDVDFPEPQQEFGSDRIAHCPTILAPLARNRLSIMNLVKCDSTSTADDQRTRARPRT